MEPNWTKQISSETVCNFFYVFFVIYAAIFVLSLLGTVGVFAYAKKLGGAGVAIGLQGVLVTLIGATMMLFYYLICDRALLAKGTAAAAKEGFEAQRRQPY